MSARKLSRLAGLVLAFVVALGAAGLAGSSGQPPASQTHATATVDVSALSSEWE